MSNQEKYSDFFFWLLRCETTKKGSFFAVSQHENERVFN